MSKPDRPNIMLILNDDMGYSDLGCYGGEINTPNLDRLAANGLRFTQFYNTARCCPSRASLLTGLHPHQADVGDMVGDDQVDGYLGDLSQNSATIAEVLKGNGYRTYMSGKWHVTGHIDEPGGRNWPCQRGFDRYYGMLCGAGSYYAPKYLTRDNTPIEPPDGDFYLTDAIADEAVGQLRGHVDGKTGDPFFQYVAFTAPHWPLHARPEDIETYRGNYDIGWDRLREQRLKRMRELGLIPEDIALSPRDPGQPAWEDEPEKEWQAKRMEVYAAQIDRMDQGIGRILDILDTSGELENTLVIFLADNGGCHEEIGKDSGWARSLPKSASARSHTRDGRPVQFGNNPSITPGPEDTYASYGIPWANVSNTPFRKYKSWIHEGGISTPFIVHWPKGISEKGSLRSQPAQLPDVMATVLELTGATYPTQIGDREILPHEGFSLGGAFANKPHGRNVLTWEHEGNSGIRRGKWKLVREFNKWGEPFGYQPWELYDIEADRSELNNLAEAQPDVVSELATLWQKWADRCKVQPFDQILERRQ